MDLTKLSKKECLAKCEELGIKKCKSKSKSELIDLINGKSNVKKKKTKLIIKKDDKQSDTVNNTNFDNNEIVIFNSDCIIELNKLKDNTIDCVITDPPYFIDKLDNNWSSDEVNTNVKNSHIKHLPKGMKFDKSQVKNLYDYYCLLKSIIT